MFVILTEFQGTHVGCIRVILKSDYLWRRRYKNYFQIRGLFTTKNSLKKFNSARAHSVEMFHARLVERSCEAFA